MTKLTLVLALVMSVGCSARAYNVVDQTLHQASRGLATDTRYVETPGGSQEALDVLQARAEWLGVDVQYLPGEDAGMMGATGLSWHDAEGRHARVTSTLSINGRLEVLAHELAHLFQPPALSKAEAEVFAEVVSLLVCRAYGVDTSAATAKYLQAHKSHFDIPYVYRREVNYAVHLLTANIR